MICDQEALWLNTSPALQVLHSPLIQYLQQFCTIRSWDYSQTVDEPSCLQTALDLLHDYLNQCPEPVHLLGHSTGGLMAWLYAYRYPENVRSVTLLSVGGFPAVDWQAHYYMLRQLMPCGRELVLRHMVDVLFGKQCQSKAKHMVRILDQDLTLSLSPHSLLQVCKLPAVEPIPTPLLVSSAHDDYVVDQLQIETWKPALKKGDHLWICPQGRHFFHYFFPQLVGEQISSFWQSNFLHSRTYAQLQKSIH